MTCQLNLFYNPDPFVPSTSEKHFLEMSRQLKKKTFYLEIISDFQHSTKKACMPFIQIHLNAKILSHLPYTVFPSPFPPSFPFSISID